MFTISLKTNKTVSSYLFQKSIAMNYSFGAVQQKSSTHSPT